jgi:hypothetical protein
MQRSLGNPSSLPPLLFLSLFLLILYWRRPYLLFLSPSRFSGPAREHMAPAASGPSAGAQLAHRGARVAAGSGAGAPEAGGASAEAGPAVRRRGRPRRAGAGRGTRAGAGGDRGGRASGHGVRAPARGPSGARRSRRCGRGLACATQERGAHGRHRAGAWRAIGGAAGASAARGGGSAGVGRAQAIARGRQQSQATAHGGVGAWRQNQGTAPGLDGGEWQKAGGAGARCGWRERCAGVWEAWSKRVSGTRTKRRWGEARGVAAREQKGTGVAACGCVTDMLDASGPEQAMACRTRANAAGARPGRRRAARSEQ